MTVVVAAVVVLVMVVVAAAAAVAVVAVVVGQVMNFVSHSPIMTLKLFTAAPAKKMTNLLIASKRAATLVDASIFVEGA